MAKYLLERFDGESYYLPFNSIAEVDEYRKANPQANGELWTHDGHKVDEDKVRRTEQHDN